MLTPECQPTSRPRVPMTAQSNRPSASGCGLLAPYSSVQWGNRRISGRGLGPALPAVAGRRGGDPPAGHRLGPAERQVDVDPAEEQLHVVVGHAREPAHREAEPARVGEHGERLGPRVAVVVRRRDHDRRLVAQLRAGHGREAHEQATARLEADDARGVPPADRRVGEQGGGRADLAAARRDRAGVSGCPS